MTTVDLASLFPNISHDKSPSALRKWLGLRQKKMSLVDLAEVALKNIIFSFMEKALEQNLCTANFASSYSLLFLAKFEEHFF